MDKELIGLLQIIQKEIDTNPHMFFWNIEDIVLAGSRVYGYYTPSSDYDVVVYMNIPIKPRKYEVVRHTTWYNGLRVSISLEDISQFNKQHRGFTLPRQSLFTGEITNWDAGEIAGYITLRKTMEPGWDNYRKQTTEIPIFH